MAKWYTIVFADNYIWAFFCEAKIPADVIIAIMNNSV